jgi:predicted transcriptional regulator
MESTPFQFGQLAAGQGFVNRTVDLAHLHITLSQGVNTILIAPRRWGKTSLVHHLSRQYGSEKLVFCHIDLYSVRDEKAFFELLGKTVINATHNKLESALDSLRQWLSNMSPKISLGQYPDQELGIEFDFSTDKIDPSALLNLPEKIAQAKNIRLVLCFDEFQNIEYLTDSLPFQKLLRSHWQKHQQVTYLLYGRKRHMLMELFEKQSYPFYKFGQVVYLDKIPAAEFEHYIYTQFAQHNKKITKKQAKAVVQLMDNKPYHVQQLAFILFNQTQTQVDAEALNRSLQSLLTQGLALYQHLFESLSNMQVKLMNALVKNDSRSLYSHELIKDYQLKSSANVTRSLQGLEDKEIIDRFDGSIDINDPGFRIWWRQCLIGLKGLDKVNFEQALRQSQPE